jgi:glycosyltransferase involved in cell wall biosynthesis
VEMGDGVMDLVMSDVLMERVAEVGLGVDRGMDWVHVPTPGDHYSPGTGSAIMTIIYEISRVHAERGGRTRVVVSRGTCEGYPAYEVGEVVEVPFRPLPKRWQKAVDVGLGRLGIGRPFGAGCYRPAVEGIEAGFSGVIFIHNNPVAVPMFKRRFPGAVVCLWANNELFGTYTRREANRIAAAADRLICCSGYIAGDLRPRVDEGYWGKLGVVHNGVDVSYFHPCPEGLSDDPPVVLFIGRVVAEKGPDLLLKAGRKLHEKGMFFRMRIVGSSGFSATDPLSEYEQELRRIAEPMRELVEFAPFVDRKALIREFQSASIYCVPSNWDDPCPLTVPEGMACGLPTVVSRRGGIPEEGSDAVLYFDPPDVDGLAEQLRMLLSDRDLRERWSAKARARAVRFSWSAHYRQLVQCLVGTENASV